MKCPVCGQVSECSTATLMRVKGVEQMIVDRLSVSQEIGGEWTRSVLIVCVHKKWTTPPKEPTTEPEAEQS